MKEHSDILLKQNKLLGYDNGLSMEGYYVWGGSVIKVNDIYHMFASRWLNSSHRAGKNELDGYSICQNHLPT